MGHDFCESKPGGTARAIFARASRAFPSFAASARRLSESGTSIVRTSPGVGERGVLGLDAVLDPDVVAAGRGGDVDVIALLPASSVTSTAEFSMLFMVFRFEALGSNVQSLPLTRNL